MMSKNALKMVGLLLLAFMVSIITTGCESSKTKIEREKERIRLEEEQREMERQAAIHAAIRQVLEKDPELAAQRDRNIGKLDSNEALDACANKTYEYSQNLKKVVNDTQGLPEDFVIACNKHVNAWENLAGVISQHPNASFWGNFLEGFIRGLLGDPTGGAAQRLAQDDAWQNALQECGEQIDRTWKEVQSIASKYGVE